VSLPIPIGRQRDVLYLPTEGHFVVLGTAGSGKTTLAILRSAYLGNPGTAGGGKTLLVTFNRALVAYLKHLHDPTLMNVVVENYHKFARGYLASRGKIGRNTICGPELKSDLIRNALNNIDPHKRQSPPIHKTSAFLETEIEWMERQGIASLQDYRNTERVGRAAALDRTSRDFVYRVYESYLTERVNAGKEYDWDDIAGAVIGELNSDTTRRVYRHVVIDEGQDFSPQMIRSLAGAIPPDGSLTLFGDMAQQIYGRRISWKSAGLKINRVWEFKENYRNTKQIAALGLAISAMPYFRDTPDMVAPVEPKADGPLPALVRCASMAKEFEMVRSLTSQAVSTQTVAVLFRRREMEATIARLLPRGSVRLHRELTTWQAGPKVYYGTYHAAKGLEFDTVLLPLLSDEYLPDPEDITSLGVDEATSGDGKLLYVGVTRAKTRLVMTYSGNRTPLLPISASLYQQESA
jgi:superfamily I DNA/RNA helicase